MIHSFANVLYLSICMLENFFYCSFFYFRLLTFFKIKFFLKINHPGPPSECQTVWIQIKTDILLVFIQVQGYWQTTKLSTGMLRVITGKFFSVQYIVSYRDIHVYVYHKYLDTSNTFNMLCPLNKAKVIFKGSS